MPKSFKNKKIFDNPQTYTTSVLTFLGIEKIYKIEDQAPSCDTYPYI
jgi:hypothetical protein